MRKTKEQKAITLIALVITIVILLILAGITIAQLTGNGLIEKAQLAKDETLKQTATEKMNFKITEVQISSWTEKQRMPTLQELADKFCENENNEFEYVLTTSKKTGAKLENIVVADSIFTKFKEYPYEFEINSSLQLESIDGVKIAVTPSNDSDTIVSMTKSELQDLIKTEVSSQLSNVTNPSVDESLYDISTYSSENLSIFSDRISNLQGGVKQIGNIVYVFIIADVNASLAANNSWKILTGLPNSKYSTPLDVAVDGKEIYGARGGVSCFIDNLGQLRLGIASNEVDSNCSITIKGSYMIDND